MTSAFQPAPIAIFQGFGIVGELFLAGPTNAQPGILDSADAEDNLMGRAFTVKDGAGQGSAIIVEAGGTGVFAGILCNPKVYAARGTVAGGTLAPTIQLPNNSVAEFATMTPGIIVDCGAANVGDQIEFLQADGTLNAIAPSAGPSANSTIINGASVVRYDVSSGLSVIALGVASTAAYNTP